MSQPWNTSTSHHRSTLARPASSTLRTGNRGSLIADNEVVTSTTSCSVDKVAAIWRARMAGPAILGVRASQVATTMR